MKTHSLTLSIIYPLKLVLFKSHYLLWFLLVGSLDIPSYVFLVYSPDFEFKKCFEFFNFNGVFLACIFKVKKFRYRFFHENRYELRTKILHICLFTVIACYKILTHFLKCYKQLYVSIWLPILILYLINLFFQYYLKLFL